ncbi:MAG: hypothetical protein ACFBSF_19195 [Leptolyngbyaceae cyanobacterium]
MIFELDDLPKEKSWTKVVKALMGLDNSRHYRASLNALSEECRKALVEYHELARRPELSEQEFLDMQGILEAAESNDVMSLLINEIDEITFRELGLYDESQQLHFENEASKAQEFVLDEAERKLLVPSNTSARPKFIGSDAFSYSYLPRVEMVFDASHTARVQLEKGYLIDDLSMYSFSRNPCLPGHRIDLSQNQFYCIGKAICTLFLEESVSLFAIAGFAFLLLLLLLM